MTTPRQEKVEPLTPTPPEPRPERPRPRQVDPPDTSFRFPRC